jgi:hypothetical protein
MTPWRHEATREHHRGGQCPQQGVRQQRHRPAEDPDEYTDDGEARQEKPPKLARLVPRDIFGEQPAQLFRLNIRGADLHRSHLHLHA